MALCDSRNVIINHFRFRIGQFMQRIELENEDEKIDLKDIQIFYLANNNTIDDLFYVEKKLVQICPEDYLTTYYEDIKNRYLEVLPGEAKRNLSQISATDGLPPEEMSTTLRKNTMLIVGLVHKYYHFLNDKERVIAHYKLLFIILLLVLVLVSAMSFLFSILINASPGNVLSRITLTSNSIQLAIAMICAGYFGAVISIVKRIQDIADKSVDGIDREDLLLKLVNGKWGIYLSILLGSLSPFILLLLLFIISPANPVIGSFAIFPQFTPAPDSHLQVQGSAMSLIYGVAFLDKKDVAEFILLSIGCGFTERFIPDVLDRVSKDLSANIHKKDAQFEEH